MQAAIDELLANDTLHTLVVPASGGDGSATYVVHDLHVRNAPGRIHKQIVLEDGVLLQRSGGHIGALTSPGFFTIHNSSNFTLRGLATLDAFNGGQGLYVADSSDVRVDGLMVRNSWWWNTEIEHSTRLTLSNYIALNDPGLPFHQNDGVNFEHSTHVALRRAFLVSADDLTCVKADPEDGAGLDGSYTPDIGEVVVDDVVGLNPDYDISLKLGWGAAARRIYNVSYSNIDLIDLYPVSRPGDVINLYLTLVHRDKPVEVTNISFTNITFDKQGIKVDMPHGYAHVKGVRFENIRGQRGNFSSIELSGHSDEYGIDDVLFRDVYLGGRLLTAESAAADGMKVAFARGVRYESSIEQLR